MLLITIIIITSRYDDYNFYMINVIMINMTWNKGLDQQNLLPLSTGTVRSTNGSAVLMKVSYSSELTTNWRTKCVKESWVAL